MAEVAASWACSGSWAGSAGVAASGSWANVASSTS